MRRDSLGRWRGRCQCKREGGEWMAAAEVMVERMIARAVAIAPRPIP